MFKGMFGALAASLLASTAWAAPMIDLGSIVLQPNRSGQTIQVFVTGGQPVSGINFNLQIGDGGPEAGGTAGPRITGVDLVTGTIFDSNHAAPVDVGSIPQLAIHALITQTGTVSAEGLLATITIDTTGFVGETFALAMNNTLNGPSDFGADDNGDTIVPGISDGELKVSAPEPATLGLLTLIGGGLLAARRQRVSSPDQPRTHRR